MYKERKRIMKHVNDTNTAIDPVDAQSMMSEYDTPLGDYMEIAIGYGYLILFAAAFPLVPLIAFFLAGLELIVDAWKLCNITRRPFPERASSIGIWMDIIQALSFIGSISNVAILVFTNNVFDLDNRADQWLVFFVLEHCLILVKAAINMYIPNIPQEVQQGQKWGERVVNEVLYGKISDIDKMIELRNLRFSQSEGYKIVGVSDLMDSS